MIIRRYNTYELYKKVPPNCATVNGRYLAPERVPYFRLLWQTRGMWTSLPVLMDNAGDMNQARATDTLLRLKHWLEQDGMVLEMKRETVFPEDPVLDTDTIHTYYRLTTPETLPPPRFTREPTLEGTEDQDVPLEEADRLT